jgi:hypothetical protein
MQRFVLKLFLRREVLTKALIIFEVLIEDMKLSFPEGHTFKVSRDQNQYVPVCRVWDTDSDSHGFALNLVNGSGSMRS